MNGKAILASWVSVCLLAAAAAGESTVTVRFGEQDTCAVTKVTTGGGKSLRFDVSSLPADTRIVKAELRYWVSPQGRPGRAYNFSAYADHAFDGVKVWDAADAAGKPLDVRYPFNRARYGLMVFDVTPAAARWVKDGDANKGLAANVALPRPGAKPAWQRPYLQVTYVGPNPKAPKQPTALKAACRSGQVFLTWKQIPHTGAFFDSTYRLYRHGEPISAANLDKAVLLGEVNRLSQLNHRRTLVSLCPRYGCHGQYRQAGVKLPRRFNFVADAGWATEKALAAEGDFKALREDRAKYGRGGTIIHQGPQLSDEAGVFVWTVRKKGRFHYAVTSVVNGNENRRDFGPGNATAAAVEQRVAEPQPVLQVVFNTRKNHHGHYYQYREYVLWADERFHNVPGEPLCFLVVLSADPRNTPQIGVKGFDKTKFAGWANMSVMLNGYSSHYWHNLPRIGMKLDTNYLPATPQAPFPPNAAVNMSWPGYGQFYYGSAAPPPAEAKDRGWRQGFIEPYGYVDTFNTTADARKATVQPYLERMVRWMVTWANRRLPFNPRRWTIGEETGPLVIAMHSGDLFGAADVSQCYDWSARRADGWQFLAGMRSWKLKTPDGVNVWDHNSVDWYARKFPRKEWPAMTHLQSTNYSGGEWWKSFNMPAFYLAFPANKRYVDAWWIHCGDCPRGNMVHVEVDEPHPAFDNCSISDDILAAPHKVRRGSLFGYISWSRRSAPLGPSARRRQPGKKVTPKLKADLVDTPERFEMAFKINRQTTHVNYDRQAGPTRASHGMTDVTLRRVQRFKVVPGRKYRWVNRKVATGQYLQVGTITPDANGLLTVKGFFIDRDDYGNKLIIVPEAGQSPPAIPKDQKVGDLAYADYVARCKSPELYLTVKGPRTVFVNTQAGLRTGLNDEWGGQVSDMFHFRKAGRYNLSVRAKGQFGLGWPMMSVAVGKVRRGPQVVDTDQCREYTWYDIPVSEGLHDVVVRCVNPFYYRRNLAGDAIRSRRTTIEAITFDLVPAGTVPKPAEIRILPRRVEIPAGMPVTFTATVLDQRGKAVAAKVSWSASGGKIGPGGIFTAGAGKYTVTAAAGGLKESAPIRVTGRFWEDFDTGSLRGWQVVNLAKGDGDWAALWGGNMPPLQSLRARNKADSASALIWTPGVQWKDYIAEADVIYPTGRTALRGGGPVGVVVRASAGSHCRVEIDRKKNAARLVERAAGRETVLAETDKLPPRAKLDPATNAICRALNGKNAETGGRSFTWLANWGVDRIRVEVRGKTIKVVLNGKDVFGKSVPAGKIESGTVGLFAGGSFYFDNVQVRAAR